MSRVLTAPSFEAAPRDLARPAPATDAFTVALLDEATADAYARGRADGAEDARAAAAAAVARVTAAVQAASAAAIAEVRACDAVRADEIVALAFAVADAVIGREPHDGGRTLLARVRDALNALDDPTLRVTVSSTDLDLLVAGLADLTAAEIAVDPSLAPGEARVIGTWAQADCTQQAAWDAVRAVLDV